MNNLSITSRILDNDPEGKSGRGTLYELFVQFGKECDSVTYGLMDEINCTFNREAWLKPWYDKAKK